MANDLNRLSRKMRGHAAQVLAGASDMTRRVALAIDQNVVLATPVDVGRARANWVMEVGAQPPTGIREPYAPGSKGSTGGQNAQAAIAQAMREVNNYKDESQFIFITNNLEYIGKLNEGSSPQAPPGFVQSAIARGVAVAKNYKVIRSTT